MTPDNSSPGRPGLAAAEPGTWTAAETHAVRVKESPPELRLGLALISLLTVGSLAACSALPPLSCSPGQQRLVNETLYFGTATPTGSFRPENGRPFSRIRSPRAFRKA
jgi:hypothetical protein